MTDHSPWFMHPAIAQAPSTGIRTRLGISANHASFRAGVLRTHLLTALLTHSAAQHLGSQAHVTIRWDDSDNQRSRAGHRARLLDELQRVAQIPFRTEATAFRQSMRGDRYGEAIRQLSEARLLVSRRGLPCLDVAAVDQAMTAQGVCPESLTACASVNGSTPLAPAREAVPLMRSDGRALWHLATVVDDIDNRTALIVRGTDKREATPVQARLHWALNGGQDPPAHVFLPKLLEQGDPLPRVADLLKSGIRPSALRCFLARPYLRGSMRANASASFFALVARVRTDLPQHSDSRLDEQHLRSLDRKISARLSPEETRQELVSLHPECPSHVTAWIARNHPRPLAHQSLLCRALTNAVIGYEAPPAHAESAVRWLDAWTEGNTTGPPPHPVRWVLTGQRDGPSASELLEIFPAPLLAARLHSARQELSRSNAARSRSSVRSRPSSSRDSKSGSPTVRPVTATRTGA